MNKSSAGPFSGAGYGKPLSPDIQNDPTPENMVGTTQRGGTVSELKEGFKSGFETLLYLIGFFVFGDI